MGSKEIDKKIIDAWARGDHTITQLRVLQTYLYDPDYRESLEKYLQEEWEMGADLPSVPNLEEQYDNFRSRIRDINMM